MLWLALKLAAAATGISLILYGAYIDGRARKQRSNACIHGHGDAPAGWRIWPDAHALRLASEQ